MSQPFSLLLIILIRLHQIEFQLITAIHTKPG